MSDVHQMMRDAVRAQCAELQLSQAELARRAGVTIHYVRCAYHGRDLPIDKLISILHHLGLELRVKSDDTDA